MDEINRFNELYDYIRSKGKVHNKKEFAAYLEYDYTNISKAFNGKYPLKEIFNKLLEMNPEISSNWISTGKGEMLKINIKGSYPDKPIFELVPLVNEYAYAGYLSGFSDPDYMESLPKIPVPRGVDYKGEYLCFEVKGDSMDDGSADSIVDGEILICKPIYKDMWGYKLPIRRYDFVLVHKREGILVKRIVNHNIDTGDIEIHSINPLYEDKKINIDDIDQIFYVAQTLRTRKRY